MKLSLCLCLIICVLFSCEESEVALDQAAAKTMIIDSAALKIDILVFKKEKVLQVWAIQTLNKPEHLYDCQLLDNYNWPIGVFERSSEESKVASFLFPSTFYKGKSSNRNVIETNKVDLISIDSALSKEDLSRLEQLGSQGRILIFPSKPDKEFGFESCLNCPHWTAELFVRLELELNQYKK